MSNNPNLTNMQMMQMIQMMNSMQNNIKDLLKENKDLKDRLNKLEAKFEQYKKEMDSNCYYNQFDVNAYILDDVYNLLTSRNIIQNKAEFGLINKGIRHLFNKNMTRFECIYSCKGDEFDPSGFKQMFNNLTYSVLIISTKDRDNNKRFGSFFHNNSGLNNNNNNMNQNINYNNQTDIENIFNSNSVSNNSFVFTFDDLNIYYNEDISKFPSFSIIYNKKYQSLLGIEKAINNNNNMAGSSVVYKLSGKNEFSIKYLELYEINI